MRIPAFEYMRFAKTTSQGARINLTQSGLGPPPSDWLGDPKELMDLRDAGTGGTRFLREKIAARYGVAPDEVFVTPGASGAIHLLAGVLCERGEVAAVERPVYPPIRMEPQLFGAEVKFFDRKLENGFAIDPEAALALKARTIWLTNLHNPSGAKAGERELAALAAGGARVVACELYADYLGDARPKPVAVVAPGAVSIGSVTKAFGLGALRIGWVLCKDRDLLEKLEIFFDHLDVNCAMPSMKAAAAMFDRIERFEAHAGGVSARGRAIFLEWAEKEKARGRIAYALPAGGIIAFPRLNGVSDTKAFARRVREKHDVQLNPGEHFSAPGHLRIGFGIEPDELREGLAAISAELPTDLRAS